MAITYKEIKDRLTDLGFEEDDVTESDYSRIFINSLNRAAEMLYGEVLIPLESYFMLEQTVDDNTISFDVTKPYNADRVPRITKITDETEDDDEIEIPYEVIPMYTLLAAYFAWLDDDEAKAVNYYNIYDSYKTNLINSLLSNVNKCRKAQIIGGF